MERAFRDAHGDDALVATFRRRAEREEAKRKVPLLSTLLVRNEYLPSDKSILACVEFRPRLVERRLRIGIKQTYSCILWAAIDMLRAKTASCVCEASRIILRQGKRRASYLWYADLPGYESAKREGGLAK